MKKVFIFVMVFSGLFLLSGCAGYRIIHNGTGTGYDVYRPEPYLLIKQGVNALVAEIIWLPNYDERYRIKTWNLFGKADFEFEITDGWKLTKISADTDNTAIASKLLDVVKEAASEKAQSQESVFMLYRLEYNDKGHVVDLVQVE
jgi:hypothetical protein